MVTIIFEAEVEITDKQFKDYKKLPENKDSMKIVYDNSTLFTVFGREAKLKRAHVKETQ